MEIGGMELMVILLLALLLFGAKRLPEIARSLGRSIFEFKKAVNTTVNEVQKEFDTSERESKKPVSLTGKLDEK